MEAAITAVSKYGGASAGYRTMLDAFIPASQVLHEVSLYYVKLSLLIYSSTHTTFKDPLFDAPSFYNHLTMVQRLNSGDDPATAFILSAEAARAGAESTKDMQAQVSLVTITIY